MPSTNRYTHYLHMCAPCSKLPSIIRTMFQLFFLSPVFFIVLVSRGFASGFCLFYSKTKIDHGSSFCFPQARALFLGAFLKYWLTLSSASKVILGILEERVYHNLYYLFFSALRYLVLYSQWLFSLAELINRCHYILQDILSSLESGAYNGCSRDCTYIRW